VASAWEIAIKWSLGRLPVPEAPAIWLPRELEANAFTPLAIQIEHALAVGGLPAHHRDPFDRLLVAQAKLEQMTLLTGDERLTAYGLDVVLC
jgi:PIN domain nuclease of toxin-antitoxin system